MASPTTDGLATVNNWTATSTKTVTLSTTNANDLIVVAVFNENSLTNLRTLNSVTSAHLTFTKRSATTSTGTSQGVNRDSELAIYTAPSSGALTSEVITCTLSAAPDDAVIIAFGISGLNSTATPFDPNVSLPATYQHTSSGGASVTFSTSKADDLLIYFYGVAASSNGSTPTGYSNLASVTNTGGGLFASMRIDTKSVSATQSSVTVATDQTGNISGALVLDAFTADASSSTETGTGKMALSGISFSGAGSVARTATGGLALSGISYTTSGRVSHSGTGTLTLPGISYASAGIRTETGTGRMSLAGVSFVGSGSRVETGAANMHLTGISFSAVGQVIHVKGQAIMALRGISIVASAFDVGTPGKGVRQFWTF